MSRRRPRTIATVAAALVLAAAGAQGFAPAGEAAPPPTHARPTKVVVVVVDALSRQIVEKYDMRNVEALMHRGVDTPHGYLGHTGSVTVVTHNVITSGQLPKHMGWTDEGYRDVADVLPDVEPDNPDELYITSNFGSSEMFALQQAAGYPKLQDYLGAADPSAKTFTISPKRYAAWAFGGAGSDSIITFGSSAECPGVVPGSWRPPDGIEVPSYIAGEPCSRFWVHSGYPDYAYDTTKLPAVLYPLDSDRYVTGHDPAHRGGDVWAADVAVEVMRHETNWNGIFVTLPGVDKAAHMWGGVADPGPTGADGDPMTHLKAAAAVADRQVGKIIGELKAQGELDDTLVVLTADHGSVAGLHFYGDLVAEQDYGYYNWYYGDPENDDVYDRPQAALQPLVATGNVGLSYSDSMLRVWLKDQSPAEVDRAVAAMRTMAGVTAVWRRDGDHFDRVSPVRWSRMHSAGERRWFASKAQELVDTEAADYGPDLIATLPDNTTYSVAGDHGGIQRAAQRIPIVFAGAGLSARDLCDPVRSVDIMPTVLRAMGISATYPMDGIGYALPTRTSWGH